jgi:UDP-N-acetylglucosamine--N-acetylmuramyl-(pentapeptide) pyrophosphoryl-undecaprenol N-acetylglucosamine transferase
MPESFEHTAAPQGLGLIVAGGGTGGHLFPGIAVAQAFAARSHSNRVLFVNAGRPLEREVLTRLGWDQKAITIEGLKGRGLWRQICGAFKIPGAIGQAKAIIKAFGADLVLGVGGYSAGPVVFAAWLRGILTAIHEQNRLPGVTNRLLSRIARRVYVSFADSQDCFSPDKVLVSGNPVRREIQAQGQEPVQTATSGPLTILVIGGSQGAQAINQAFMDALDFLEDRAGLRFIHQTGNTDEAAVRQAYLQAGFQAEVKAFFNDMAKRYAQADLLICRAGATTVAEITIIGKAAVFIPFPYATDDHQTRNAEPLVAAGAADMIHQADLTGPLLAEKVNNYLRDRAKLEVMAEKARMLGHPNAAEVIVADMYKLVGKVGSMKA